MRFLPPVTELFENLGQRFLTEVQLPEARVAWFQLMMENIHSEMYSLLIDTYIKDEKENLNYSKLLKIILSKKADWAIKWIQDNRSSVAN